MHYVDISNIAIITVKGTEYCCITYEIKKSRALIYQKSLSLMIMGIYKMYTKETYIKNQVSEYYDNLIKPKNIETKNILIYEKHYEDLVISCTKFVLS